MRKTGKDWHQMNNLEEIRKNYEFNINLLAPCGLYCGVCLQFTKSPKKSCYGCNSNKGFAKAERKMCGIVKCCQKLGISRCNECKSLDNCNRMSNFISWDSFVSHTIARDNLKQLTELGIDGFINKLKELVNQGNYPPKPNPGGIRPKNIWKLIKPPYKPEN